MVQSGDTYHIFVTVFDLYWVSRESGGCKIGVDKRGWWLPLFHKQQSGRLMYSGTWRRWSERVDFGEIQYVKLNSCITRHSKCNKVPSKDASSQEHIDMWSWRRGVVVNRASADWPSAQPLKVETKRRSRVLDLLSRSGRKQNPRRAATNHERNAREERQKT